MSVVQATDGVQMGPDVTQTGEVVAELGEA